ncbi:MAG: FAD binding domain-containing protein [Thermoplasmata archaeon]|nr:FAD binding domain-containing protein [Thermoplasmata archaeon]
MHLDPFELHEPATVEEALELAGTLSGKFDYLAGGTDLLPNYKMHINLRPHLISLERVSELRGVSSNRIGAMTRLAEVEESPDLSRAYPGVAEAVREVATPLVRASGTVGGNLLLETRCFFFNQTYPWRQSLGFCLKADGDRCHVVPQKERCYATFSGDLAPALAALEAEVEVAGPSGRRRMPVEHLYNAAGDGILRLSLVPGEIVVAIHFPESARRARSAYTKLRVRPSFDFPELGVAAAVWGAAEAPEKVRLAIGGLETYPRRFDEDTDALAGAPLTDARVRTVAEAVTRRVRPVHNTFLPPDYRRRMTEVFVRRTLSRVRAPNGSVAA